MPLKIPWKSPFSSGTKWATQGAAYLNIRNNKESKKQTQYKNQINKKYIADVHKNNFQNQQKNTPGKWAKNWH